MDLHQSLESHPGFCFLLAAGLRTPLAVPGPYPAPFGMVPHAGMNGELTSPGAAYASLHNMSPQMSAAAAAAAVVAYGRSPMVSSGGHQGWVGQATCFPSRVQLQAAHVLAPAPCAGAMAPRITGAMPCHVEAACPYCPFEPNAFCFPVSMDEKQQCVAVDFYMGNHSGPSHKSLHLLS